LQAFFIMKTRIYNLFNKIQNRILRVTAIITVVVIILALLIISFLSPISKFLIEKYSEKYAGRKIVMSWLYVNPFTGRFHAHDLKIMENKSDSSFIRIQDCSFNISFYKLFSKKLDVSAITLEKLRINIVENKSSFNWDGFFTRDTLKPKSVSPAPLEFSFRDIRLINSEVVYSETSIPVHYYTTKINVQCPVIQWDSDTSSFTYDFNFLEKSGHVKGFFSMNFKDLDYHLKTSFDSFDMKSLDQYIKEFSEYGYFSAMLNANLNAHGNFHDAKNLIATGKLGISDFHFGKSKGDDYLRFSKLLLNIDTLSPVNKKYLFKTVLLDSAYVKYQRYDSLDNFSQMIGDKGAHISKAHSEHHAENIIFQIADYIASVAKDLVNSNYRADTLLVSNAHAHYDDFSLAQQFSVSVNPLTISASHVDTRFERTDLNIKAKINPFGNLEVHLNVNPTDFGDFLLDFNLRNLPIPLFNPYLVTYTSYPFDNGSLALSGKWKVKDNQITSLNHLLINNPTLAERVKEEDAKKRSMRLILFLIRDVHREIEHTIPINGNLNNPHYVLSSAIWQVLANILVKPTSYPYTEIKAESEEKKRIPVLLEWKLMQRKPERDQNTELGKVSRHLFFHPGAKVVITPYSFKEKEKEMLLMFEARKLFYLSQQRTSSKQLTETDSVAINKLSIRNPAFLVFLQTSSDSKLVFSNQEKALLVVGQARIDELYLKLINDRQKSVLNYFREKGYADRVTVKESKNDIPASGFSHYLLDVF
jgi:hypothetical protein